MDADMDATSVNPEAANPEAASPKVAQLTVQSSDNINLTISVKAAKLSPVLSDMMEDLKNILFPVEIKVVADVVRWAKLDFKSLPQFCAFDLGLDILKSAVADMTGSRIIPDGENVLNILIEGYIPSPHSSCLMAGF